MNLTVISLFGNCKHKRHGRDMGDSGTLSESRGKHGCEQKEQTEVWADLLGGDAVGVAHLIEAAPS